MRALCLIVLMAVHLGASALPAFAQIRVADSVLRATTSGLGVGSTLRVTTFRGSDFQGRFNGVAAEGLVIDREADGVLVVPASQIAAILERRRAWRKGMRIGGLAGGALGILLAVAATQACEFGQKCQEGAGPVIAAGVGFVIIGAGAGALTGLAFPEWHTLQSPRGQRRGRN